MKIKVKFTCLLLSVISLTFVCLSACSNSIPFKIVYRNSNPINGYLNFSVSTPSELNVLVDSYADFISFKSDDGSIFPTNNYNEKFFETKALIFIVKYGGTSDSPEAINDIKKVTIENGVPQIKYSTKSYYGSVLYYKFILEVNLADLYS